MKFVFIIIVMIISYLNKSVVDKSNQTELFYIYQYVETP